MKETFSSEKEKIACKGAMEVAYTSNPLPVIRVADTGIQPLITNKQVYRFDSHKNSRFHTKNNVHYEKAGFQCRSTGMTPLLHSSINYWCHPSNPLPVIRVADTGIQPLIANKQVYRFDSHKNSRFHAKNNVHYEKTGSQCLGTGMTPFKRRLFPNHNVCTVISGITSGRLGEL